MKPSFWIKRFFTVFLGVFAILFVVALVKDRPPERAATEGLLWAFLAAAVFVSARLYQSRRGQHCALCRDTPEMVAPPPSDSATKNRGA